eukprot:15357110-Ditylum_brightwellii.AAC.1
MPTFGGYDKEIWSSKVIIPIWSIFCLIWNARNAYLHTEMATTCSSTLDLQVHKAFSLQHSMLFHMPLPARLQTSQESKTIWLRSVSISVNDFTIIHGRLPSQRTITDFFKPQALENNSSPNNIQVTIPEDNDTDFMPVLI